MKKIILASQYKSLLQKYTGLLTNWGFHIYATTSGTEVLRLHKEHNVDLIVSDFELEKMSGCTLCSLIRQEKNRPPVPIILICHNIPRRIERGNLSGASAIIVRPIEPIKLLQVIGDHIGLNLIRGKRVAIKVAVAIKKNGQEFICHSRDISNTGILLNSDYSFKAGDSVTCKFALPDSCQVEIDGEIVRYMTDLKCENLYGIKFIAVQSFYQQAIAAYVASCSPGNTKTKAVKSESFHNKVKSVG